MELVVIKFGGGLITDKEKLCTPNLASIKNLCAVVKTICQRGQFKVILIHGAGSFGHLKAKTWRLTEGKIRPDFFPICDPMGVKSQEEAVESVRADMLTLNKFILEELDGIPARTLSPHTWASGNGKSFQGDLAPFYLVDKDNSVVITHGDAVDVPGDKVFGILSGDDIAVRLVLEADRDKFKAVHMIFAMTGAPGLMTHPPGDPRSELVQLWHPGDDLGVLEQNDLIDVTGGIRLKLDCASSMCSKTDRIWIVDGNHPERIMEALLNGKTLGTRITS